MPWQRKADSPYVVVTDAGIWGLALIRFPFLQYLAPVLGGEVIDVTTFCAAGPEFIPPVTMADIIWLGFPPLDGRPWTLLGVTRQIARQELFAKYCESAGGYWTDPVCLTTDNDGTEDSHSGFINIAIAPQYTTEVFAEVTDWTGTVEADAIAQIGPSEPQPWSYSKSLAQWRAGARSATVACAPGWHLGVSANMPGQGSVTACVSFHIEGEAAPLPEVYQDPNVELPSGEGATLDQLEVKLDQLQELMRARGVANFALDIGATMGPAGELAGDLVDAVGLLVTIIDRPNTVSEWWGIPPRYPHMAYLTLGNSDGWWDSTELDIENTVVLPLPTGANRFSIVCQPPMRATVTPYRPTAGPV